MLIVKVWNAHYYLVTTLSGHLGAVTAMSLLAGSNILSTKKSPLLLSCSLDGTIRLWNFENSTCIYRADTQNECLGLIFLKKDIFMHWTKSGFQSWNLNRFVHQFTYLR